MNTPRTAAFVGAAGGVGATRLAVEAGALLAAEHDVLVLDAAYATQGLSAYLDGRLDPDATALATDPALALADATHGVASPGDGSLSLCPAHAPFARVAAAQTAEAGERLGERVREAAAEFDHVIVDAPPVTTNAAIGAVDATDRIVAVTVPGARGADALARERARIADVGRDVDVVAANRADADALADADVAVSEADLGSAEDAPAVSDGAPDAYARGVASLVDAVFDVDISVDTAERGFLGGVRGRFA